METFRRYPRLDNPSNPSGNKPTSAKKLLLCLVLVICFRVHKKAVYECFNNSLVLNGTFPWKLARCCQKKYSLLDLAKQEYACRPHEGTGLVPSLHFPVSQVLADSCRACKEGWALKGVKKAERFNEAQKSYLGAKFNIGQSTGKKLDPDVFAKEMCRPGGQSGDRLFAVTKFFFRPTNFILLFLFGCERTSERCAWNRTIYTRGRRGGQLLYSQRQSAFVPQCHSPYCGRSVRLVCLGKKQGNKEAESGFAASPL